MSYAAPRSRSILTIAQLKAYLLSIFNLAAPPRYPHSPFTHWSLTSACICLDSRLLPCPPQRVFHDAHPHTHNPPTSTCQVGVATRLLVHCNDLSIVRADEQRIKPLLRRSLPLAAHCRYSMSPLKKKARKAAYGCHRCRKDFTSRRNARDHRCFNDVKHRLSCFYNDFRCFHEKQMRRHWEQKHPNDKVCKGKRWHNLETKEHRDARETRLFKIEESSGSTAQETQLPSHVDVEHAETVNIMQDNSEDTYYFDEGRNIGLAFDGTSYTRPSDRAVDDAINGQSGFSMYTTGEGGSGYDDGYVLDSSCVDIFSDWKGYDSSNSYDAHTPGPSAAPAATHLYPITQDVLESQLPNNNASNFAGRSTLSDPLWQNDASYLVSYPDESGVTNKQYELTESFTPDWSYSSFLNEPFD